MIYHVFPRSSQSYDSDVSLLASEVKESVSLPTKKQNSYTFVLSPPAASRHCDTKRKTNHFLSATLALGGRHENTSLINQRERGFSVFTDTMLRAYLRKLRQMLQIVTVTRVASLQFCRHLI